MRRKGVLYDVGRVMGVNWRPDCPDMTWEPKQSFAAVAKYYAGQELNHSLS